jgi:hypothetical protein
MITSVYPLHWYFGFSCWFGSMHLFYASSSTSFLGFYVVYAFRQFILQMFLLSLWQTLLAGTYIFWLCVPLFAVYVQRRLIFSRSFLFIITTYFGLPSLTGRHLMYRFVVVKYSAAHCNAVLLYFCNCLGLILGYVHLYT